MYYFYKKEVGKNLTRIVVGHERPNMCLFHCSPSPILILIIPPVIDFLLVIISKEKEGKKNPNKLREGVL